MITYTNMYRWHLIYQNKLFYNKSAVKPQTQSEHSSTPPAKKKKKKKKKKQLLQQLRGPTESLA